MDRVRRGEHDLTGVAEPLRQLLAEALHPEPGRRPTVPAVLGWLRPQVRPTEAAPAPRPAVDKMTLPYAVARTSPDAQTTDAMPGAPVPSTGRAPDGTRMLTEEQTVLERDPGTLPQPPPVQGRPPFAERARRATLLAVGALFCGAVVAAFPWWGSAGLLLVVWLLRGGSLAASAAGDRRRVRGRKWYDGAQLLVRWPWDLLRSLPGTLMLQLWSAGLAVAAALLCYAFVAGETVTLFVCGAVFAASVWTGPGGHRVRSPISRLVNPASKQWRPWLVVTFLLLVLATATGALAQTSGSSWSPGQDRPLSGPPAGQTPPIVAGWGS
jgi:hypothetical protein